MSSLNLKYGPEKYDEDIDALLGTNYPGASKVAEFRVRISECNTIADCCRLLHETPQGDKNTDAFRKLLTFRQIEINTLG